MIIVMKESATVVELGRVIKVLAEAKTTTRSLESVTGDIRYILRQQVKQAHQAELQAELKIDSTR